MTATIEKHPAGALKFHFGGVSTCEFAEPASDGKVAVKIKARSRGPVDHWYWGRVVHDMAGMKLSKNQIPIDYCHREDEVLGALTAFDTGSGDLLTEGFVDANDSRAAEIIRKAKMGVPYEASILFDRRTVEAERLSDQETATVNGVTVKGPITIIRKWTLRGVAVCPHGYDPKTSTRFSENSADVAVQFIGRENIREKPLDPAVAFSNGMNLPGNNLPAGTLSELQQQQEFITKFGVTLGSEYFGRGLSIEKATEEHVKYLQEQNTKLRQQVAEADKA